MWNHTYSPYLFTLLVPHFLGERSLNYEPINTKNINLNRKVCESTNYNIQKVHSNNIHNLVGLLWSLQCSLLNLGDHGKFTDLSPTIQQLCSLATFHSSSAWHLVLWRLELGTPAQLYNSCSHQEIILKILFLVMIRV
jgi:hypothetical protein